MAKNKKLEERASRWLGSNWDKILHYSVCLFISVATWAVCFAYGRHGWGLALGVIVPLSVGVAKELFDSTQPGNEFSWGDLAADAIGTAVGIAPALFIYFIGRGGAL